MVRLFIALFTGLALVFIAIGAYVVREQQRKMTTYLPVEATVVEATVERRESRDRDGDLRVTYEPVVRYRFEVDGTAYTASDLSPAGTSSGSQPWAEATTAKYPPGSTHTAWHDPAAPREAFLVRAWSFGPYLFVLFPMIHLSVGLAVALLTPWGRPAPTARLAPRPGGWYELTTASGTGRKVRAWTIIAAAWWLVGAVAAAHYFAAAERPYGTDAIVALSVYGAVGLVPLGLAVYYLRLKRSAGDPRVFIDRPEVWTGDTVTVRVEQHLSPDVVVEALRVGMRCDESVRHRRGGKTKHSTHCRHETWETLASNATPRRGMPLEARHTFTVPPDEPPTSPASQTDYPRHAWRVEVRTKLLNSPDWSGSFPLEVGARATGAYAPRRRDEAEQDADVNDPEGAVP